MEKVVFKVRTITFTLDIMCNVEIVLGANSSLTLRRIGNGRQITQREPSTIRHNKRGCLGMTSFSDTLIISANTCQHSKHGRTFSRPNTFPRYHFALRVVPLEHATIANVVSIIILRAALHHRFPESDIDPALPNFTTFALGYAV